MHKVSLFLQRSLLLSAALVFLLSVLVHSAHIKKRQVGRGFSYSPAKGPSGPVFAIGDVNDVLWGRVSQGARTTYWPANGIVGFGAGTVGPLAGLGEAVFANGYAFVRQTDNGTANYFQTVADRRFRSPFSVLVLDNLKSDGSGSFEAGPGSPAISLSRLYEDIHESVGGSPFCFYGLAEYEQMDAIAVSKAPIYGESLFGANAEGYYTQPNFQVRNAYGLTFGCAANFSQVAEPELFQKLSQALYVNPLDDGARSSLQVHSHILTLQRGVNEISQIKPDTALDVYHLLSSSTIQRIRIKVFKIDRSDRLIGPEVPVFRTTTSSPVTSSSETSRFCGGRYRVLHKLCSRLFGLPSQNVY